MQTTDNQAAIKVRFIQIFMHNAQKHFTISISLTPEQDRNNRQIGDINSLLSIASSSKFGSTNEFPIGKFGLRFKSVFQYADRSEIYDDDSRFAIVNYIVPEEIASDHP